MAHGQVCNISCSEGYENLGGPIQIECLATRAYDWVETTGVCAEKACHADSVPYMANVVDSSPCVGIPSGANCSPVCNSSYELLSQIKCTRGEFVMIPLVCIRTSDTEALDSAEVLLAELALVETSPDSGLTADWATGAGVQDAIVNVFGAALGLYSGQVHVLSMKDLNSDSESGIPTRRLTTQQGLWIKIMLQLADANNATALAESLAGLQAGGAILTSELVAALEAAGVGVPPGLATATLVVGTPEATSATLPVARWVATTPWSECSAGCGTGQQTRTVECLTGDLDLCNANAPPYYTMEAYMPDSQDCDRYASCPFDWTCPSGRDPVTGEGCDTQAAVVISALVVSFLIVFTCLLRYVRTTRAKKTSGTSRKSKKFDIDWTREDEDRGQGSATQQRARADTQLVIRPCHQAFHVGQGVEYWSRTAQAWLAAKVTDVRKPHFDAALNFSAPSYDLYVGAAGQAMPGVEMKDLRLPLAEGEPVSVFSHRHGRWYPAWIQKSTRGQADARPLYDVELEGALADDQGTYVRSELQRDPARHIGAPARAVRGDGLPALAALSRMPPKRLRRRYDEGDLVRLYRGADVGFVQAEVVREEPEQRPRAQDDDPRQLGRERGQSPRWSPRWSRAGSRDSQSSAWSRGGSRSPDGGRDGRSPGSRGGTGSDDEDVEGALGKTRRYDIGSQRHATVVVRLIGSDNDQEPSPSPRWAMARATAAWQWALDAAGAGALPEETAEAEVTVPDFLLWPATARRRGRGRMPRPSSPSRRGARESRSPSSAASSRRGHSRESRSPPSSPSRGGHDRGPRSPSSAPPTMWDWLFGPWASSADPSGSSAPTQGHRRSGVVGQVPEEVTIAI